VWDDLAAVDWGSLEHNYGTAQDVPGLLRASAGGDVDALDTLENHLFHQGGWVCPAATAALPFLVRLATDPAIEHRANFLEIVTLLVREAVLVQSRFLDDDWPATLHRELPRLLELLSDADPVIRRAMAYQAGALPVDEALAVLMDTWAIESDRITQRDIVLSLGDLVARAPATTATEEVTTLLTGLLKSDDEQLALASVHALHTAGRINPADHVPLLLRAVTSDVTGWSESAHVGGGRSVVTHWTGMLLSEDAVAAGAFAIGIGHGASDPERRVAMATAAGELLQAWRTPASALLPELLTWLEDPEPEMRFRAAFLLGGIGPDAAEHADALAAVAADRTARVGRSGLTVGAAGLWALSRLGDQRCVPELLTRIARSGPNVQGSAHFARSPHSPMLPALHEQIILIPQYSDDFLSNLRRILGEITYAPTQAAAAQWITVITAWGEGAAATVPELTALLAHESTWWPAGRALARIGPAAAEAAPALLRRAATSFDAAWAHWRITGRTGPVMAAYPKDLSPETSWETFQLIGDLGPLASADINVFRDAARSSDDWVAVAAARACWTTSGDEDTALTALLDVVNRQHASGTYRPIQVTALRHLATMGPAARPAIPIAQAILDNPRRISNNGGWRAFTEDDEIRATATELIRAATPSRA
jgi:HEAT repeat protein